MYPTHLYKSGVAFWSLVLVAGKVSMHTTCDTSDLSIGKTVAQDQARICNKTPAQVPLPDSYCISLIHI